LVTLSRCSNDLEGRTFCKSSGAAQFSEIIASTHFRLICIAEEIPVASRYDGFCNAVMVATPTTLKDFRNRLITVEFNELHPWSR
jgi:hypothetical protein